MFRRLLPITFVGVLAACGGTSTATADVEVRATSGDVVGEPVPGSTVTATASGPTASSPETEPVAPANVPAALQFTAPLLGGGDIEMATLASRPVLLWFWAPW